MTLARGYAIARHRLALVRFYYYDVSKEGVISESCYNGLCYKEEIVYSYTEFLR